jgi:hypothetical protein
LFSAIFVRELTQLLRRMPDMIEGLAVEFDRGLIVNC